VVYTGADMQGIIETTEKLAHIATRFNCVACGKMDYIKYGNGWKVPNDWQMEIKL
jgi:hypothetical protein